MRRLILAVLTLLVWQTVEWSDYSTPGTGVMWNMDRLVTHSGGAFLYRFVGREHFFPSKITPLNIFVLPA